MNVETDRAAISSKVIAAAIKFDGSLACTQAYYEFPLPEWDLPTVMRCVRIIHGCGLGRIDFDDWINLIKLASYLEMRELRDICQHPGVYGVATAELIDVALQHRMPDMIGDNVCNIKDIDVFAALSVEDIIWLIESNDSSSEAVRHIAAYGIMSRTVTAETETLMMHFPLTRSLEYIRLILDSAAPIAPASRRLLEFIYSSNLSSSIIIVGDLITGAEMFSN